MVIAKIATTSKIRIYDPLYPHDTLAKIRLSPEALDKLDNKIKSAAAGWIFPKPLWSISREITTFPLEIIPFK